MLQPASSDRWPVASLRYTLSPAASREAKSPGASVPNTTYERWAGEKSIGGSDAGESPTTTIPEIVVAVVPR